MADDSPTVTIGTTVYTEDGEEIGTVRGFDPDGFFVTTREGVEALSVEHERSGGAFGEAELLWRCGQCGAVGNIDEIPETCPDCGAAREEIYYWTED